jgi:hypothetical protein
MAQTAVGKELKTSLGLDKFKYALITKVLETTQPIYVVHVDSMYPGVFISYQRIKSMKSFSMNKLKKKGLLNFDFKKLKQTPPIPLDEFYGNIANNALVIVNDLSGEWRINTSMYESTKKSFNLLEII